MKTLKIFGSISGMRSQSLFLSAGLLLGVPTMTLQAAEIFSYSVLPGASIQFNGSASTFQFNPSTGEQWSITGDSGGTGSALNLLGSFSGGPWTYGPITVNGSVQTATVNPTLAVLTIDDGAGYTATADVTWGVLSTYLGLGAINANVTINLSNLSYSGANVDLLNFFSAPAGELTLNFTFDPAMTLSQLTAGSGPYTTSFSGSMTSVPEPSVLVIWGLGLVFLVRRSFSGRLS